MASEIGVIVVGSGPRPGAPKGVEAAVVSLVVAGAEATPVPCSLRVRGAPRAVRTCSPCAPSLSRSKGRSICPSMRSVGLPFRSMPLVARTAAVAGDAAMEDASAEPPRSRDAVRMMPESACVGDASPLLPYRADSSSLAPASDQRARRRRRTTSPPLPGGARGALAPGSDKRVTTAGRVLSWAAMAVGGGLLGKVRSKCDHREHRLESGMELAPEHEPQS